MNSLDGPLQGLQRAQTSFDQAADRIARSSLAEPEDQLSLSDNMVALMNSSNDYEANLKSLEVSNQMTKKLLDVLG
ncbi:MAG TPA: hypothetical protein VLX58_17315 [Bryobacteraceae bacterium]|nr:hypothetical protein [Bryobacteraceae bacterium]